MFSGNWSCADCGAAITQRPFQPDPGREGNLRCRDCHANRRPSGGGGGGFERRMYSGNWKCAGCGADINELPFEPDPDRADNLKCRDCFRKSKEY